MRARLSIPADSNSTKLTPEQIAIYAEVGYDDGYGTVYYPKAPESKSGRRDLRPTGALARAFA